MSAGPYANPNYNNAALQQYASLYGVDPSQIQYVNGQYQVGGPSGNTGSTFQPSYIQGQQATGGGVNPSPLNPTYYASDQTAGQVANLVGGSVDPYNMGAPGGVNIPTANGVNVGGQNFDAGVLANLASRGYSPESLSQQFNQQSGGAINITPGQAQQFMGAPSTNAAPLPGGGWSGAPPLGQAAGGGGQANPGPSTPGSVPGGQAAPGYQRPGTMSPQISSSPQMSSQMRTPGGGSPAGGTFDASGAQPGGYTGNYATGNAQYGGPASGAGTTPYSGGMPFTPGGIAIPGGAMPTGQNPAFPNWNQTSGATNPSTINNPIGNVSATIGGEYGRAIDYGNTFQNQFGAQYTQDIARQNAYQGQSDLAYSDLYNTPGYTSAEASQINQQPYLQSNMTTPGQYQSNYLTAGEQAGIQGDPYATLPGVAATQGQLAGNLSNTAQAMGSVLDPNTLTLSDDWVKQQQSLAGQQIGLQYGASQDQLQRGAAAAGNSNPLAIAAAQQDLGRQQAIQEADATTQAGIQARQAQLASQQQYAGATIGAATTLGQLGQGAAEFGGQLGYQATATAEQQAAARAAQIAGNRQGINQYNQQQQYGQAANTAGMGSQWAQNIAGQRIQGQQAARNYWTGQGQWFGTQAQAGAQNQLSGAQTSLGAMGQASNVAANTSLGRQSNINLPFGNFTL